MEGSAEGLGAPESWETEDLDQRMSRLLDTSPSNTTPASSSPPPGLAEVAPSFSVSKGIHDAALIQVDDFLREALEKPRERLSILRMEQDVEKFIRDPTQRQMEFQSFPTSYLRLAAHRVAQHYYLQSLVVPDNSFLDGSGSRIVLCKTSECRFPLVRLADIPVNLPQENSNTVLKVAIKQRPQKCSQTTNHANIHSSKTNSQKSVEERKEEYNRARARIFTSHSTGGSMGKSEFEPSFPYNFQHSSFASTRHGENTAVEGSEISLGRVLGDRSSGGNGSNRNRTETQPGVSRYEVSNRVAIFRDREVDCKDPDYDRNYERYMQRFDTGFGFNWGPYTMQPMSTPAVNYNTEFPQFESSHRHQISLDHLTWPIPQHLRGPFSAVATPTGIGYGPPEAMMTPFNPNHVGAHATSSIYMPSSQYSVPPRPGVLYGHPHENVQAFVQTYPQQPEASFGLARPR